jgi:hypothetical protein
MNSLKKIFTISFLLSLSIGIAVLCWPVSYNLEANFRVVGDNAEVTGLVLVDLVNALPIDEGPAPCFDKSRPPRKQRIFRAAARRLDSSYITVDLRATSSEQAESCFIEISKVVDQLFNQIRSYDGEVLQTQVEKVFRKFDISEGSDRAVILSEVIIRDLEINGSRLFNLRYDSPNVYLQTFPNGIIAFTIALSVFVVVSTGAVVWRRRRILK